jgi:rubrerythrin
MVAAEFEAVQVQLYMQLAESTDNKLAKEVLKDIADEELSWFSVNWRNLVLG